jgi:hypothetical protein
MLLGMGSQFRHQQEPESDKTKGVVKVVYLDHLGKGATGVVDSVWDPDNPDQELARKTIRLPRGGATSMDAVLAQIRREVKTLELLGYQRHIVRLVGWHDTSDSMQLLMAPAAEDNLMAFLTRDTTTGCGEASRQGRRQ